MLDDSSNQLALHGGEPAVNIPPPHFRWPLIGEDEETAVLKQLRSGEWSLPRRGGVVDELESSFASMHGRDFSMSTCSGTAALHAAYFGLNLQPGDEVLVPAYTHLGTVLPMLHCGLVPLLCEVEESTGNIDVADAGCRITERTRAIAVTHQYGHICDMDAALRLAAKHGLYVVEDCSHAHGARRMGRLADSSLLCFRGASRPASGGAPEDRENPHPLRKAQRMRHPRQADS